MKTEAPILRVEKLSKNFGGLAALHDINLSVRSGEIFGLIGPNGAGKTTLFNLLSGALRPDSGRIVFKEENITRLKADRRSRLGIGRTFQIAQPFLELTVEENVFNHGGWNDDFRLVLSEPVTDHQQWAAVSDGRFGLELAGTQHDIAGVDLSGVTSMQDVASQLEAAINAGSSVQGELKREAQQLADLEKELKQNARLEEERTKQALKTKLKRRALMKRR